MAYDIDHDMFPSNYFILDQLDGTAFSKSCFIATGHKQYVQHVHGKCWICDYPLDYHNARVKIGGQFKKNSWLILLSWGFLFKP